MEKHIKKRDVARQRRKWRVGNKYHGSSDKPRISIFKSNSHLYVQIINDDDQKTLVGLSTQSKAMKEKKLNKCSKPAAKLLGELLAQEAKKQNITRVVFDRGIYKFHGVIAEMANAAREAGLQF